MNRWFSHVTLRAAGRSRGVIGRLVDWAARFKHSLNEALPNPPWNSPTPGVTSHWSTSPSWCSFISSSRLWATVSGVFFTVGVKTITRLPKIIGELFFGPSGQFRVIITCTVTCRIFLGNYFSGHPGNFGFYYLFRFFLLSENFSKFKKYSGVIFFFFGVWGSWSVLVSLHSTYECIIHRDTHITRKSAITRL